MYRTFSSNEKVGMQYLTEVPQFLKKSKVHYSRRLDDTHVKNNMAQAFKRYEDKLLEQQKTKDSEHCSYLVSQY